MKTFKKPKMSSVIQIDISKLLNQMNTPYNQFGFVFLKLIHKVHCIYIYIVVFNPIPNQFLNSLMIESFRTLNNK